MRAFLSVPLVALMCSAANAAEIRGSSFSYGNWSGSAYTNDEDGAFSHCAVTAPFLSGDNLHFSVNRQATVSVGVSNDSFNFRVGESFPVQIYVDRRAPFYGTATAVMAEFAFLEIPDFERALTSFQRGYTMRIQTPGAYGEYDLTGTFRALEMTRQCAINYFNYVDPSIGAAASAQSFDKTLLFQVASEVISDLGVDGFTFLSNADLEQRGFSKDMVYWTAPDSGLEGGVLLLAADGINSLRETDSGDSQYLAGTCDGDFATSAREIPFDGTEVRELRLVCARASEQSETYLTKVLLGESVLYSILSFSSEAEIDGGRSSQSANERAAVRAASLVVE